MSPPPAQTPDRFFASLQHLLVEGEFVASYKYALLLSLTRWAIEHPDYDESNPLDVRELAAHFLEIYWPQAQPFVDLGAVEEGAVDTDAYHQGHPAVLIQDRGRQQPRVIRLIIAAQARHGSILGRVPTAERSSLLDEVRRTITDMPLWKLQVTGRNTTHEFLYQRGKNTRKSEICLFPGVVARLARFAPLIDELVRSAWLRFVMRCNTRLLDTPAATLEDFLFPRDRKSLQVWRPLLVDAQDNQCFYCERELTELSVVDHFLPWSRYPRDLGHNFVLTDPRCNTAKAAHLASARLLEAWCRRNEDHGQELAEGFDSRGLPHDLDITRRVAGTLYAGVEELAVPVWDGGQRLVDLAPEWRQVLGVA